MGLFSKKPKPRSRVVEPSSFSELGGLGRATYQGGAANPTDFYLEAFLAAGPPRSGTAEYAQFVGGLLEDLSEAAAHADNWTVIGAFTVAADFLGAELEYPRYVELLDRALVAMSEEGLRNDQLPPFVLDRWRQIRDR